MTLSFSHLEKMETIKNLQENLQVWYKKDLFLPEPLGSADMMPSLSPQVVYFLQTRIFPCMIRVQSSKIQIYTDKVLHVALRLKQCISDWDLSPPAKLEPSENHHLVTVITHTWFQD